MTPLPSARLAAVDEYIARARPFAQPILIYLREAVHRAAPGVAEQIKWSMPFFVYRGVILGHMAGFKEHCSFGFWGGDETTTLLRSSGVASGEGMGSFGKVTSLADLPSEAQMNGLFRHAADLIGSGARTKSIRRVAKPTRAEVLIPEALAAGFKKNRAAAESFAKLSPSCRREYVEWITGAKREETRSKRVATALAWIAEGKSLNWRYE